MPGLLEMLHFPLLSQVYKPSSPLPTSHLQPMTLLKFRPVYGQLKHYTSRRVINPIGPRSDAALALQADEAANKVANKYTDWLNSWVHAVGFTWQQSMAKLDKYPQPEANPEQEASWNMMRQAIYYNAALYDFGRASQIPTTDMTKSRFSSENNGRHLLATSVSISDNTVKQNDATSDAYLAGLSLFKHRIANLSELYPARSAFIRAEAVNAIDHMPHPRGVIVAVQEARNGLRNASLGKDIEINEFDSTSGVSEVGGIVFSLPALVTLKFKSRPFCRRQSCSPARRHVSETKFLAADQVCLECIVNRNCSSNVYGRTSAAKKFRL